MQIRTIKPNEVEKLLDCLVALAEHHNVVSLYFAGAYPAGPYAKTLEMFSAALMNGKSQIAVIEEGEAIVGFCKLDFSDSTGKIDYLIVLPEYHSKGYGKILMEWAIQTFRQKNVSNIDVKVVAGNDSVRFYEKYGFKINAQILRLHL